MAESKHYQGLSLYLKRWSIIFQKHEEIEAFVWNSQRQKSHLYKQIIMLHMDTRLNHIIIFFTQRFKLNHSKSHGFEWKLHSVSRTGPNQNQCREQHRAWKENGFLMSHKYLECTFTLTASGTYSICGQTITLRGEKTNLLHFKQQSFQACQFIQSLSF